jgi:hypothetical protein
MNTFAFTERQKKLLSRFTRTYELRKSVFLKTRYLFAKGRREER